MTDTPQSIKVKISIGELLDKITILEIKAERISDAQKLRNVTHELSELCGVANLLPASADSLSYVRQLKEVNTLLWDVEDALRECEHDNDFGERFVLLARSVYKYNDRRALLKKKLNELMGSELTEEKSYSHDSQ